MNKISALILLLGLALPARASQGYTIGPWISTTTGRATQGLAGTFTLAASSTTLSTPTVTINGQDASIIITSITTHSSGLNIFERNLQFAIEHNPFDQPVGGPANGILLDSSLPYDPLNIGAGSLELYSSTFSILTIDNRNNSINQSSPEFSAFSDGSVVIGTSTIKSTFAHGNLAVNNTISAATATITYTMTAGKFIGDGSSLSGISPSVLAVTTYTQTAYVTFAGSTSFTGNFAWGLVSVSSEGAWGASASGSGSLIGGSTITLTASGQYKLEFIFSGCTFASGGTGVGFLVEQDSVPLSGFNLTNSFVTIVNPAASASNGSSAVFDYIWQSKPSAGRHTYSVDATPFNGGTVTFDYAFCPKSLFTVREIPY